MEYARIPPFSHPLDLNLMIHSMRNQWVLSEATTCFISHLPNEVLCEIFCWLLRTPPVRPKEPPSPILVSHVCRHWRKVVVDLTPQWENLHIRHTRHPDVFSTFISRSKERPFGIRIELPPSNVELWPKRDQVDFNNTFKTIYNNISRLYALHVESCNQTLRVIFSNFFKNVSFSRLELLSLVQIGNDPLCNFGPVAFNPNFFRNLRLERAMINCDAPCLSGLKSLSLISSSGTLLDQTRLTHPTYPAIPTTPTMAQLTHLKIDGTTLIPQASQVFSPSFNSQALVHLTLASIFMVNEASLEPILELFSKTWNPKLRELALVELDDHAFMIFLQRLEVHYPKYPLVTTLVLESVNLHLITEKFMPAFPNLRNLTLIGVDPTPLFKFLTKSEVWPQLRYYRFNDHIIQRLPFPAQITSDST